MFSCEMLLRIKIEIKVETTFVPGKDRGNCVCGRCKCREQFDDDNCGANNCTYVEKNICKKNGVRKSYFLDKSSGIC